MKFYLVTRPSFRGTVLPVRYYTFAADADEAIRKGEIRWDARDERAVALEIAGPDMDDMIIPIDGCFNYLA
jgi:hypothetical protein